MFGDNPYQSRLEYVKGVWKCPCCNKSFSCMSFLDDCTLKTISNGEVVGKRLECLECGYREKLYGKNQG